MQDETPPLPSLTRDHLLKIQNNPNDKSKSANNTSSSAAATAREEAEYRRRRIQNWVDAISEASVEAFSRVPVREEGVGYEDRGPDGEAGGLEREEKRKIRKKKAKSTVKIKTEGRDLEAILQLQDLTINEKSQNHPQEVADRGNDGGIEGKIGGLGREEKRKIRKRKAKSTVKIKTDGRDHETILQLQDLSINEKSQNFPQEVPARETLGNGHTHPNNGPPKINTTTTIALAIDPITKPEYPDPTTTTNTNEKPIVKLPPCPKTTIIVTKLSKARWRITVKVPPHTEPLPNLPASKRQLVVSTNLAQSSDSFRIVVDGGLGVVEEMGRKGVLWELKASGDGTFVDCEGVLWEMVGEVEGFEEVEVVEVVEEIEG